MKTIELEKLSENEMLQIKGGEQSTGKWIYIDGEWIYISTFGLGEEDN
ncbi:hypothetical protein [uncultured Bacteroides sp.]|nr:hypothetical protein [uncultured Bacteroides sp.]